MSRRNGFGGRERDASRRFPRTRRCSPISKPWSSRRAAGIRNRRCGGPARACAAWRRRCKRRVTRSAAPWSATCSMRRVTVISVDTKKKEPVGDFRNNGREYRPQGNPEEVRVHDFLIKELGRAVPYGIYDLAANSGWVSVGIYHDTAAFAVDSIRQWWQAVGRARYPNASRLLITADGGGSNGSRVPLWKRELQKLANELGLDIVVSHLPPGTSKWNKIEHRLFSFISQNWRAKPLVSYRVIVELISATTTKTGLTVRGQLDTSQYPSGIIVSDAEMAAIAPREVERLALIAPAFLRRRPGANSRAYWKFESSPLQQRVNWFPD